MIAVEAAIARIRAAFSALPAETISLDQALGRVLAQAVAAHVSHPPCAVSAMDGYAIRADDVPEVPAVLRVPGASTAGAGYVERIQPKEAVRIFTGAPVPAGADTIIIQEHTQQSDGHVVVQRPPQPGRHIRRMAQDFAAGDVLLKAGRRLSARDLGLVAAMNVPWLRVHRKPRIAVVATGDELVLPGEPIGPAQIVSSASVFVTAALRGFGAEPVSLGITGDDAAALAGTIRAARGADLLITIGGASVGDFDLVRRALDGEGFDLDFYKVAMRPGKPLIFGRLNAMPVLGLPGNPVSAGITLLRFAKPAIEAMLGLDASSPPLPTVQLATDLPANDDREDYIRATLCRDADGDVIATPLRSQDSALLSAFAAAECLLVRPPHAAAAKAGERSAALIFSDHAPTF
ncbi:MAG: molybdopterin molybdotransferase MoeA [Rhodospirillales bacterium]|nr:molybdopterin molybdotransferase MoeA [Rhodospirillales bacterium]